MFLYNKKLTKNSANNLATRLSTIFPHVNAHYTICPLRGMSNRQSYVKLSPFYQKFRILNSYYYSLLRRLEKYQIYPQINAFTDYFLHFFLTRACINNNALRPHNYVCR